MPETRRSSFSKKNQNDSKTEEEGDDPKKLLQNFVQSNETLPASQPDDSPTVTNIKIKAKRRSSRRSSGIKALNQTPYTLLQNFLDNAPDESSIKIRSSCEGLAESSTYATPIPPKILKVDDDEEEEEDSEESSEEKIEDLVRKMPRIRHKVVLDKFSDNLKQQQQPESHGEDSAPDTKALPSRIKKIRNKITAEDIASGIKLSQEKMAEKQASSDVAESKKNETSLGYLSVNSANADKLEETASADTEIPQEGTSAVLAAEDKGESGTEEKEAQLSKRSSKRKRSLDTDNSSPTSAEATAEYRTKGLEVEEGQILPKAKMMRHRKDTSEIVTVLETQLPQEAKGPDEVKFVSEKDLTEVAYMVEVSESQEGAESAKIESGGQTDKAAERGEQKAVGDQREPPGRQVDDLDDSIVLKFNEINRMLHDENEDTPAQKGASSEDSKEIGVPAGKEAKTTKGSAITGNKSSDQIELKQLMTISKTFKEILNTPRPDTQTLIDNAGDGPKTVESNLEDSKGGLDTPSRETPGDNAGDRSRTRESDVDKMRTDSSIPSGETLDDNAGELSRTRKSDVEKMRTDSSIPSGETLDDNASELSRTRKSDVEKMRTDSSIPSGETLDDNASELSRTRKSNVEKIRTDSSIPSGETLDDNAGELSRTRKSDVEKMRTDSRVPTTVEDNASSHSRSVEDNFEDSRAEFDEEGEEKEKSTENRRSSTEASTLTSSIKKIPSKRQNRTLDSNIDKTLASSAPLTSSEEVGMSSPYVSPENKSRRDRDPSASDLDVEMSVVSDSRFNTASVREVKSSLISGASSPITSHASMISIQSNKKEKQEEVDDPGWVESLESQMHSANEDDVPKELKSSDREHLSTDEQDELFPSSPKETTSSGHSRSSSSPSSEVERTTHRLTLPSSKSAFVEMKPSKPSIPTPSTSKISPKRTSSIRKSSKRKSMRQKENKSYQASESVASPTGSIPAAETSYTNPQILPESPFGAMRQLQEPAETVPLEPQPGPSQIKGIPKKTPKKNRIQEHLKKYIVPPKVTSLFINHYSGLKIPPACLPELGKISDRFINNLFEALNSYAKHASRKKIQGVDVELYFKRVGLVNKDKSLNTLIREYLPLEDQQLLIPVARAGNIVTGGISNQKNKITTKNSTHKKK